MFFSSGNNNSNDKIVKYLDELAEEYKSLLFAELLDTSDPLAEPSVADLLRIDAQIKKPLYAGYKRLIKRRKMFLSLGITYICLGFVLFVGFQMLSGDFSRPKDLVSLMSVSISITGVLVSLFAFILPNTPHKHIYKHVETMSIDTLKYEVITKWRDIEGIVSDLLAEQSNSGSIISFLHSHELIDEDEQQTLRMLLKMRNDFVHAAEFRYTRKEILMTLEESDKIIKKIREIT